MSIQIQIYKAPRLDLDPPWVPPVYRVTICKGLDLNPTWIQIRMQQKNWIWIHWKEDISKIADFGCFGPPGSGSVNRGYRYRSGSGSFYHQAKILRKPLIPPVLSHLCDFLSLKNDVNVRYLLKVISKKS